MNRHVEPYFPSDSNCETGDYSGIFRSEKREKFLFENSKNHHVINAREQLTVSYRKPKKSTGNDFIMRVTVDAESITTLRHLILKSCGDMVLFMRVKPVDHASKMKVWLCLSKSSVDIIISNIMRNLPQAEFGKVTPLSPA